MTLAELFELPDWSESSLAAALRAEGLETYQSTISRLRNEEGDRARCASLGLALAIERVTGGLVKAEEVPMREQTRVQLALHRGGEPPREARSA